MEYAKPEDFLVLRDENDRVLPLDVKAPGFGTIKARPLSYGDMEHYGNAQISDLSTEEVANILNRHLVIPSPADLSHSGSKLTADDVRRFKSLAVQGLLLALLRLSQVPSTVNVKDDGSAQIDFTRDENEPSEQTDQAEDEAPGNA